MAKDHWSSNAYTSAAGFVPKLTTKVISYLDAQPGDRILDVGCGDGALTTNIAQSASSGYVLGLDASKSFISTAQEKYSAPNCNFKLLDCTKLQDCPETVDGSWDKVFSNAAMHWILRKAEIRNEFFDNVYKALKPGGLFVFEMGANGNVAEIQAATIAALIHAGLSVKEASEACPWFFPSTDWMSATLSNAGFEVEICEHEYRSTHLSRGSTSRLSEGKSTSAAGIPRCENATYSSRRRINILRAQTNEYFYYTSSSYVFACINYLI